MQNVNTESELDFQDRSFKYQLDCLRIEIELIDRAIARFDEITQAVKNWAVVTWAGSIALALGQAELRVYIGLTAILPLLFWFVDAWWRHLQKRSIFRERKIAEFLNDVRFVESFKQRRLIDFSVLDPTGRQYRNTQEYKSAIGFGRTLSYRELSFFYGGLAIVSLALELFFLLTT